MRLLSWVFQPVYLIFFVIIAALYIYREELIPEHRDVETSRALIAQLEQTVVVINEEPLTLGTPPSSTFSNVMVVSEDESQSATTMESEQSPPPEIAHSSSVKRLAPEEGISDGDNAKIALVGDMVESPTSAAEVIEQSESHKTVDVVMQQVEQEATVPQIEDEHIDGASVSIVIGPD